MHDDADVHRRFWAFRQVLCPLHSDKHFRCDIDSVGHIESAYL